MQQGLRVELTRIGMLAVALCVIGLANEHLLLTLLIGGSLYMAWTLYKIVHLYQWLEKGARGLPPEASGVWGDVSNQLYKLQQRNRRAKTDYRALLRRIRDITNALEEGLIIVDAERCLTWWNPAAANLLGLREEDNGQTITNLVRAPAFVKFINQRDCELPVEISAPGNQQQTLQIAARPFANNEVALLVQDVTRMRRLEDMRRDFVANISHELRTPLTVLTGYIETMQSQQDQSPGSRKALDHMAKQTTRMNLLTEDLMMLSQLESTPASRPTAVDLLALITPIIDNARELGKGRHLLNVHCPAPLHLQGNGKELHSAFANLIYNAVRHNPEGCTIDISLRREPGEIIVEVADNGRGIDPKHLPRLTERFYRVDSGRSTPQGGTGLGLAIVKHVLLRHHGTLTIDSVPGKGATFLCRFESP